jgi:hydrogenase/urease accessory protein HupE
MCISDVRRVVGRFAGLVLVAAFAPRLLLAHPVAQGALDIVLSPARIAITATVSQEEVLVAAAYGSGDGGSFESRQRRHGDYLLQHLVVAADGRRLEGRTVSVGQQAARPSYRFEYPLSAGTPARIRVSEDVLREFDYAPGNPWEATYLVQVRDEGGAIAQALLTAREPLSLALGTTRAQESGTWSLAGAFMRHGVLHILTGYDHLLFIVALLLAVTTLWDLVKVISAFTIAHTLTLTLAALDLFRLPAAVVEPMIAASIVFVAVQNVVWPHRSRGASRLLVAFGFGLFHGLGFAGGLLDAMASLPATSGAVAIAAFSVGVELGHQVVVIPLFVGRRLLLGRADSRAQRDRFVQRYGSAAISCAGMVYLVAALR